MVEAGGGEDEGEGSEIERDLRGGRVTDISLPGLRLGKPLSMACPWLASIQRMDWCYNPYSRYLMIFLFYKIG